MRIEMAQLGSTIPSDSRECDASVSRCEDLSQPKWSPTGITLTVDSWLTGWWNLHVSWPHTASPAERFLNARAGQRSGTLRTPRCPRHDEEQRVHEYTRPAGAERTECGNVPFREMSISEVAADAGPAQAVGGDHRVMFLTNRVVE